MNTLLGIHHEISEPKTVDQTAITDDQLELIRSELNTIDGAWDAMLAFHNKPKIGLRKTSVLEYVAGIEPILSRILDKHVNDPSEVFLQVLFALLEDENPGHWCTRKPFGINQRG